MRLDTLGQKPFPSSLPAAGEGGAAAFRLHPGTKTVLTFAGALRGLIGAFHKDWTLSALRERLP